jgi:GNAT superfamily N-acetyltransferase
MPPGSSRSGAKPPVADEFGESEDHFIRRATENDLPGFGDEPSPHLLADRLRRQRDGVGELWIAVEGDQPVGVVYLWLDDAIEEIVREHLPGVPLIMNLWVRWDRRGRGVGTGLMTAAEARLRELDYTQVALGVDVKNRMALRLYERLQYSEWGDVDTVLVEFRAGGEIVEYPDTCVMYVKDLLSRPAI